MIYKVPYLISYISSVMTLFKGDVILTGNKKMEPMLVTLELVV